MPASTLSASLGVTHADPSGTDLIGSLDWVRNLPDGSLGVGLSRSVSYDGDADETTTSTEVSVTWNQQVNDLSQVSLEMSYALEDAPSERVEQTEFGASYSHRLTEAWNLNGGIGYRVRNDAGGRAESPNLFLSLSRNFDFRP
jgi:hypothetical protein